MRLACLMVVLGIGVFSGVAQAADEAGAPLDPEKCKATWSMASPNGEALSQGDVTPYVINYTMVDADGDGKVSEAEFTKGCGAGLIKADESTGDPATVKDME